MHCSRQTIIVRGRSVQTIIQPTGFLNNWIADSGLTKDARHLYIALDSYTYGNKDHCWPRHKTLAERTGMSIRTVQKYLAELEAKGFICSEANKYSNIYYLLAHPCILAAVARQSEYQGRQTVQQGRQTARTEYNINNNIKYPPTPQRRPADNTGGGDFSNCKSFGKGNVTTTNLNTMITRALCTDFAQKSTAAIDPDFETVWQAYPKKDGRYATTYALWMELKPDKALKERILRTISLQKNNPGWLRDDGRWIPTLKNWLLQLGWMNEPSSEQTSAKPETQVDYAALMSRPAPGFSDFKLDLPPGAVPMPDYIRKSFNIGGVEQLKKLKEQS